jgi:hypothetical protein
MTNTEGKKISQPQTTAQNSNAEYIYIIEDKEVWFIDYIIGVGFKTPIDFRTTNRYGIGLLESGRTYTELYDIKDLSFRSLSLSIIDRYKLDIFRIDKELSNRG